MWILHILARLGKFARPARLFQKTLIVSTQSVIHHKLLQGDAEYFVISSQKVVILNLLKWSQKEYFYFRVLFGDEALHQNLLVVDTIQQSKRLALKMT